MPHYYFNLYNGAEVLDDEGIDHPDLAAARQEAIRGARALIAEHVVGGRPVTLSHRIEIAEEGGLVLATVFFREVITVIY